jgi:hypothetical protein
MISMTVSMGLVGWSFGWFQLQVSLEVNLNFVASHLQIGAASARLVV